MWWPRLRGAGAAAAVCALLLGACGFEPLYGRGGARVSGADLDAVQLPFLADREGQLLRNFLQESFNPDGRRGPTVYNLEIRLTRNNENLGVRRDGTATRINLTLTAEMSLKGAADNKELFKGRALTTVSYNVLDERFATVAAEQDAVRRAARALALNITTRISAYLRSRKGSA